MIILGMNSFFEHPAVAVVRDGELAFAIEDERLTRIKHGKRYTPWRTYVPFDGIYAALCSLDLTARDIDEIAYSYAYRQHLAGLWGCLTGHRLSNLREELAAARSAAAVPALLASGFEMPRRYRDRMPPADLARIRYRVWDHHLSHAASAAFCSGFERSLVVVADGSGENGCTSVYQCSGRELTLLARTSLPHSLGLFYSFVTAHLGFEPFSDEYKVMGLAAYGEPRYAKEMSRLVMFRPNGGYRVDRTLVDGLDALLGPRRNAEDIIEQRHFDIARSLQSRLEEVLEHVVLHHLRKTGNTRLCVAGGVFLNCLANQRLARLGGLSDLFVQPAAHDAGTAIGAAALGWIRRGGAPQLRYESMFLGTSHESQAIEAALRQSATTWIRLDPSEVAARLVDRLADEKTVAVFRGRMEFGPRALGNRSILASPRSAATRARLNDLKEREQFRPLAPIVTAEAFDEFFDGKPNRYMMQTASVRQTVRDRIPAVTHADGTARVQVIDKCHDPVLHAILTEFSRRTGIPVLINTSLNVRGRPIDESPSDALASFYTSGLDCMLMGDFLIDRDVASTAGAPT